MSPLPHLTETGARLYKRSAVPPPKDYPAEEIERCEIQNWIEPCEEWPEGRLELNIYFKDNEIELSSHKPEAVGVEWR